MDSQPRTVLSDPVVLIKRDSFQEVTQHMRWLFPTV
jgi:hypothetical protein